MTARLAFTDVAIRDFRNLVALDVTPCPRINVVCGDNGQGKTSLLEALYVVATSRSFRASQLREIVRDGQERAVVRARLLSGASAREQRAAVSLLGRSFALDGKRAQSSVAYATHTPVVAFQPGDLELASGGAERRRTLLDRVALFVDLPGAAARAGYQRAMRERQRVLESRGLGASDLAAFETVAATHGARLTRARTLAAERIVAALAPAFERLAPPGLQLSARYVPGGTDDPGAFARALAERRSRDLARGAATFGPQRDDLDLTLDGRSARRHASQGQQRVLTLALKAAELECIRDAHGAHPVLLLDDVSSELDPDRTGAVYDFVRGTESQVWVTTTRPELFITPGAGADDRVDFRLRSGTLVAAGSSHF